MAEKFVGGGGVVGYTPTLVALELGWVALGFDKKKVLKSVSKVWIHLTAKFTSCLGGFLINILNNITFIFIEH